MTLLPIGVIRSPVARRMQMPPAGVPARLELFPEYAGGLLRIEKHSHVWVLAWLDGARRDLLQVIPRGVRQEEPAALHGVFAVRSPARPNPIGLTVTRVVRIEGTIIEVDRLDFLDGTPLIDVKPYFANRDLVFAAASVQIGRPASREALRDSLLHQALNFHGEFCAGLALAVRVVEHFRAEILALADPPEWRVTVPLARGCLVDAIMGMTRATPGRGNLTFAAADRVLFTHRGLAYEYEPLPHDAGEPQALLAAPEEELFRWQFR